MKKRLLTLALALCCAFTLSAQGLPSGYEVADSLIYTPLSAVDSTLEGRSVYGAMPDGVSIRHSSGIRSALSGFIEDNASREVQGYRIRIFFDNKQNARGASVAALQRFKGMYPGTSAYWTFETPYFNVTVGDYRTKSEAMAALKSIKSNFPSAFIVNAKFKYPALNASGGYRVDTVSVVRRKRF